ncbi:uncharacterized protein Cht6 [Chelonus insularis]|nr:uncharacterized protein LOC118073210 [Chelonus insularis]
MDWKTPGMSLILWLVLILGLADNGHAEKRVVCYYTNWSVYRPGTAKFSPQNINPYLCTHLIYAFGGFTKDNTLKPFDKYQDIEKGGYAKFTGLKTYNKNLKTMLAIGGWNEGSSRFSPMVADPSRRRAFVKNAVKFLRQNHFDGLDLDWEYPAFRDGGKPRDKNNYADLVQELREEFERESSKTGRPRLLLSMAIPAGIEYLEKGYDLPRLNEYLDFFNLLSYDYHSAFEPAVNHHSPLYGLEEDNEYNYDNELTIDYTISYLLKHDVSSDKIILGIPTYGRSYTLFNKDATEIGSPADGPGEEGEATREKGYLAYYEICENIGKSDEWEVVQPNPKAMGPYAFRDNQWVGYDDENIVRVKAHYVNEKSLGGIMFWSIDNDDFRGKCHERPYPLIEAAKEAMLTSDSGRSQTTQKPKLSGNRKKPKPQSNNERDDETSSRRLRPEKRRPGATTSSNRKRISSPRSNSRNQGSFEDDDDERIEDVEDDGNAVKENSNRNRSKPAFRTRANKSGSRRKYQNTQRDEPSDEEIDTSKEQSLGNKLTTPEPPTTPDPGTDFKCEDEGFFSHPRDCKKYFWCLDSGPGGLGIVAHQFTCPSGLVFNKAADSCDYPRNVICPKTKSTSTGSSHTGSTTKAPITAATSKTTFLHSTTRRTTTTEKAESEEEYEYYDEETNTAEDEDKEEATSTTTVKPLIYKTITRSKPVTTTTTSTTDIPVTSSPRSFKSTSDRVLGLEDEEDPQVIKELIDLIKKAGGLEQLEKQLKLGDKNSNKKSEPGSDEITPATISRSLYERVLNRQASKVGGLFATTTTTTEQPKINRNVFLTDQTTRSNRINYQNGPGRSQFEGLDEVPEVKSLRRTNKPHYVTIERQRPSTTESISEEDTDDFLADEESVDRDTANVASSEDLAIRDFAGNERESPFKKATPNYVNIRRPRPTTPASEDDFRNKEDTVDENQQRFSSQERMDEKEESKETSIPKSRYTSIQRFRSTTSKSSDSTPFIENSNFSEEKSETPMTTTSLYTQDNKYSSESLVVSTSPLSIEISSTLASKLPEATFTTEESSATRSTISTTHLPRTDPTIFVENFVTDSTLTTLPVLSSSKAPVSRTTVAQPRPFGFPRRGRPTSSTSLPNTLPSTTEQSRGKVSTRPTKNFVRTRTRPNQRPSELPDENHLDNEEEKTVDEKTINRSRLSAVRRGSSRYSTRTPVGNNNSNVNDFSSRRRPQRPTTSAPLVITEASFEGRPSSSFHRRRGRPTTTTTPSIIESTTENNNNYSSNNKRRRRPTSRSNIDNFSDSPIIRISPALSEGQFGQLNNTKVNSSEPLKVTNIKIIRVYDENEGKNDINNIINNYETTTFTSGTERINSEDLDSVTETTLLFSTTPSLTRSPALINRHNVDNIIDLTQNVISSTENPIEKNEQEPEVIRRKVYVRRRPISSTTEVNYQSEVLTKQNRRRKVIRRLYPVSSTANTIDEIESSTTGVNDDGRENEIITTTDSSGLFTTVRDDEGSISTNTFTNLPSIIDSTTQFSSNPTTLATEEDTLSINNDIESGESTTVSNSFEDSSTTISVSTLQTTTTTTTTEKPRFVRRKFIRKRPLDFSSSTTSAPSSLTPRRVGFRPSSDSTFNLNNLSKHRKSLFIRRRPISSTPSGADEDFRKDNNNDQDDVDDFDDREEILSQTKKPIGVENTQELPTLKSLISNNNQINNDRDHIENTFSEFKIINDNNNPDINIQNDKNYEFEDENSEILNVEENFHGIKIPVRIIDDQNKEINHQFAVLQLPRSSINSSLRGNIFKIEIIDKQNEKIFKNPFQLEINDKLLDNDHDNNDDHSNNQETALERKIREEDSTVKNNFNDFNPTSIRPTTIRRPEILIPKSQNSLRGFFITKNLDDITEAVTEDTTESDKELEIDLPLEVVTTMNEFNSENNLIDKTTGFLQSTSSFIDDNFSSVDSTTINSIKIQKNADFEEEILTNNMTSVNSTENSKTLITKNTTLLNSPKEAEEKISSAVEGNISPKNKWRKRLIRKRLKVPELEDDQTIAETELEVNQVRNSGASLRKPGNVVRHDGSDRPKVITRNPTVGETKSDRRNTNKTKSETFDQSSRAQELEVSVADPPNDSTTQPSKKKSSRFRESQRYTIDTRSADKTDVPVPTKTTPSSSSIRRQQRPRNSNKSKLIETTSTRPRQPAVIDYDYYLDEEVQLSLQRELKDKLYVTREGGVRCLDQGNFAHPTSCKKFINCARMVNGHMIATEYTCPDRLSFDPIGGICNWSAGLGCKKSLTSFV